MKTQNIVIDNGSGRVKAGKSGEEEPNVVFPAIVGRPKNDEVMLGTGNRDCYVGDDAQEKRVVLYLKYPMEHGIVTDWDDMETIMKHTYDRLGVDSKEHKVLLTEAPFNPDLNREKTVEMMFEQFEVPATYLCIQAVLSLYASGQMTGEVIDIGDGVSHCVPVFEGYSMRKGIMRLNIAGRDLTRQMVRLFAAKGHNFDTSADREIVRDIKEKLCYVALDYEEACAEAEQSSACEETYDLPDGTEITVGAERFKAPEILFDPTMIDEEQNGIHEITHESVSKCGTDVRATLLSNIILSGGTTMLKNLKKRFESEVADLVPDGVNVEVHAPEERKYSVWIGGSILSSLSTFQDMWIKKADYEEEGPNLVHKHRY